MGALLTIDVVAVFTAIGLPLVYRASRITDAVSWLGLGAGGAALLRGASRSVVGRGTCFLSPAVSPCLVIVGCGRSCSGSPTALPRSAAACVFLGFLASALSVRGSGNALAVLGAYMAGIATTVIALLVVAALLREGLGRRLAPLAASLHRVSGLLLLLAGGYLTYFWARLEFGSSATLADDPIVGAATRYSAQMQTLAGRLGISLVLASALLILLGLAAGVWRTRPPRLPGPVRGRAN